MSATITLPDLVPACRAFLRGTATQVHTPVAAVISELRTVYITSPGWIDTFIPDRNQLPRNAIRISAAGGIGPYLDRPGYTRQRVQFSCYGTTEADAQKIAALVTMAFMPAQRNMQGFVANGTRVVRTLGVTGPLPGIEEDLDPPAPFRIVTVDLELLEGGMS